MGMIVDGGEKSFKEVLEKVKAAIGKDDASKVIRTVRSTKDGKVLVTTDREQANFQRLNTLLGQAGLKTKRSGELGTAINISGMTALTTKEEVTEAIQEKIGDLNEEYTISEMRPLKDETQAVTITVPETVAEDILKIEYLRIGLARCRIEKRLRVQNA